MTQIAPSTIPSVDHEYRSQGQSGLLISIEPRRPVGAPWLRESLTVSGFNTLHVTDPTLSWFPELEVGWGLGSPEQRAETTLRRLVVNKVPRNQRRHVFVTASGACAPLALHLASALRVGAVILSNPDLAWVKRDSLLTSRAKRVALRDDPDLISLRSIQRPAYRGFGPHVIHASYNTANPNYASEQVEALTVASEALRTIDSAYGNLHLCFYHDHRQPSAPLGGAAVSRLIELAHSRRRTYELGTT